MIKNRLLIGFLILVSWFGFAQETNTLFVEGNILYQEGKYQEAIEKYLDAERLNKNSSELYFNLGNAYYQTNKVAPSIYYFEKAKKLAPNSTEILNNLAFANKMTLDNIESLPLTFLQKIDKNTIQKLSYNVWAYLAVGLLFLFAVLYLLYKITSSSAKKRMYFLTSVLSLFIGLASIIFAYHVSNVHSKNKEAIIFSKQTKGKKAPAITAEEAFVLHEGTKVTILEEKDAWTKIKLIDGQTGWIYSSDAKEL